MSTKILFIGATGYIGGSVLQRSLLEHPKRGDFDITLLLRSVVKANGFGSFGLKSVIGSLDDLDLLERSAAASDVVFHCADADNLSAVKAILRGLKTRFQDTKKPPVLIHVSGTGVLTDDNRGKFSSNDIFSDLNIAKIESLPLTQPHREVDVTIVAAGEEGYAKTYIVLPSTIWGVVSNQFTERGLQNPTSIQVPYLIKYSIEHGSTPLVGIGANTWPHIHIEEMADFFSILFDAIISGKNPASGREGFYFLENGSYSHKQLAEAVAAALYKRGKVNTDKPVPITEELMKQNLFIQYLGTNSCARGDRSRSLGWRPVRGTDEFIADIELEVDASLISSD